MNKISIIVLYFTKVFSICVPTVKSNLTLKRKRKKHKLSYRFINIENYYNMYINKFNLNILKLYS